MENETRTRIIEEALRLFSQKGYSATSVQEIAKAVGIKAPSLYNHFESKQKIFDAIVAMMTERFLNVSGGTEIPVGDASLLSKQYAEGGISLLKSTAHTLFHYYLTDSHASQFCKMLSIEKHDSPEADRIHGEIYIDAPIAFQTKILSELIKQGHLINADPEMMAIHFFSPIYLLLDKYANMPGKEAEALTVLDRHIEHFCMIYDKNGRCETRR